MGRQVTQRSSCREGDEFYGYSHFAGERAPSAPGGQDLCLSIELKRKMISKERETRGKRAKKRTTREVWVKKFISSPREIITACVYVSMYNSGNGRKLRTEFLPCALYIGHRDIVPYRVRCYKGWKPLRALPLGAMYSNCMDTPSHSSTHFGENSVQYAVLAAIWRGGGQKELRSLWKLARTAWGRVC